MKAPSSLHPRSWSGPIPLPALAAGGGLMATVLALCVLFLSAKKILMILVGAGFAAAVLALPELGILALAALTSTVLPGLPLVPLGEGSLQTGDVLLFFLFAIVFLKVAVRKQWIGTAADLPLLLFFLAAVLSAFVAIQVHHVPLRPVMRKLRQLSYYLSFFLVTQLVRDRKGVRFLIAGLIALGVAVVLFMIAQHKMGSALTLLRGRVETLVTAGARHSDILRIIPLGCTLLFFMFFVSVCLFLFRRPGQSSVWLLVPVVLLGLGLALTFTRTLWIATAGCLFGLFLVFPAGRKIRILFWGLMGLLFVVLLAASETVETESRLGRLSTSLSERARTIFSPAEMMVSHTMRIRIVEAEFALPSIARHPVLGLGLMNEYRPRLPRSIKKRDRTMYYIHNGYLWILVDMGIVGLVPFLWFVLLVPIRGLRARRAAADPLFRPLLLGSGLAWTGILIINLTAPMFLHWGSITVLGISAGLIMVLERLETEGAAAEGR